ncbi:MAG: hypothetical protein V3V02_03490 [Rhizobiaceae bacterium]
MALQTSNEVKPSIATWVVDQFHLRFSNKVSNSTLDRAGFILFALFVVALCLINIFKPEYNWDMAAYLASSLQDTSITTRELHSQVWGMMKDHAPENQFYKLTAGNPYNVHNYQNPDAFISMLPMYDVKVGYIAALKYGGSLLGAVNAAIWVSVLSSLAVGFTCLYWMKSRGFLQAAPFVASILLLCGYFYMGRTVTPDLLVTVFFLWGSERFLRGKDWLAVGLFYVAFLVRPDTIVFLFAMLLAVIIFNERKLPALVGFGAVVATYFWITTGSNHPGWWAHFYFSCVEIQNTMVGFSPDFSVFLYLKGVARGAMVSLKDNNWPVVLCLLLSGWALLQGAGIKTAHRTNVIIVAALLYVAGKFVIFPLPDDRTFMPALLVIAMVLLETWKPQFIKAD